MDWKQSKHLHILLLSSSSEEEEEDLEEDEEDEKLVFKSDHEFSPESDIEEDAQPIKRARTAKKCNHHFKTAS